MGSSTMSCMRKDSKSNSVGTVLDGVYHEKQSRELCALHALNNLFQDDKAFTKSDLDNICYQLSPGAYVNPHKSMFGLGNYDVNVIMAALQSKNYDTIWFDKRKNVKTLHLENIIGFILNIPNDYKIGFLHLPVQRKHWVAMREVGTQYYNLDSKLDAPEIIGSVDDLRVYLSEQLESKDKELLLVVSPEVATSGAWLIDPSTCGELDKTELDKTVPTTCETENHDQSMDRPKMRPKSADYAEIHIISREKSKELERKMNEKKMSAKS